MQVIQVGSQATELDKLNIKITNKTLWVALDTIAKSESKPFYLPYLEQEKLYGSIE